MASRAKSAPEFIRFVSPVVDALRELGGSGRPEEVRSAISRSLGITEQDQSILLPSGVQSRFENQVHWARFYLAKSGYIDASRRGVWTLTPKGQSAKLTQGEVADIVRVVAGKFSKPSDKSTASSVATAPEEEVAPSSASAFGLVDYRAGVSSRLLALTPKGFEKFCQRLLRESGFEEVTVTGRSNDGGIDGIGILQVNPLVSFKVLFQCKRYAGSVTPSQVRDFRGAMTGRADKGIILTTGSFTVEARKEAVRDGAPPIELVDGDKIINMLEDLELGLTPQRTFELDATFFDQFD